jgi:hypothetical protein
MADGLAEALLGLNVSAADSPYAVGQQAIAQATPQLITPYTSTGKAIGLSLGSVLLQSLLAYQARSSALQDTLQANTLANQMLKLQTPEERTAFIGQADVSPLIGSKLSTLATALTQQEQARKLETDLLKQKKIAELAAPAEFYATPEGETAWQKELKRIEAESKAKYSGLSGVYGGQKTEPAEKTVLDLRKEVSSKPEIKEFSKLKSAAEVVAKAAEDPSAVASMELVKRAVHLIGSFPGTWKAAMEQALTGQGGLDPAVRQGIIRMAERAYDVSKNKYDQVTGFYEKEAIKRGVDPERITYLGKAPSFTELKSNATSNVEADIAKLEAVLNNPQVNESVKAMAQAKIAELLGE